MRSKFLFLITALLTILIPFYGFLETAQCSLCLGGGGLSITSAPAAQTFGNVEVSTQDEDIHFIFDESIEFEDMRGIKINKKNRFTLYVTATDLTDQNNGHTIGINNLRLATDENDTIEVIDCNPITRLNIHQLDPTPFYDQNNDGISNNKILITGRRIHPLVYLFGNFGNYATLGRYSFDPEIELTIPAYTPTGNYQTTLTFTII